MAKSAQGYVVFLRAANVGGNNVFRPAQLALALPHLDVVNVGAAGTFVVRGKASEAKIRREILAQLPFQPALAVRPAHEVVEASLGVLVTTRWWETLEKVAAIIEK